MTNKKFIKTFRVRSEKRDINEKDNEKKQEVKDLNEIIFECLVMIKKSKKYADIADYYLALMYLFNIANAGLGIDSEAVIGAELLSSFCKLGNKYAIRYKRLTKKP